MEVHHHPDLHHKEKPWKEYLLEGLMIFVAVTLGFFAESLREHIARNEKEHQVIASLVRSLKTDTAELSKRVNIYMPAHNRWTDSANKYFDSLALKGNERRIAVAVMNATTWDTYVPSEMPLNLVKDAAAFDLVEKEKVKEQLLTFSTKMNVYIKYSTLVTEVEHQVDTAGAAFLLRRDQRALLAKLYLNAAEDEIGFVKIADIPADLKFKTYNKAVFLAYMRKLDQVDYLLNDMLGSYRSLLAEENKLLAMVKDEYHLKEE